MRWPGNIPQGVICNNLVASMDLLPTIVSICKAGMPAKKIDGVNILSLLKNSPGANPRDEFAYYYDHNSLKGIRKGQWKLVLPNITQTYKRASAIGNDGWPGKFASDSAKLALYNLRTDPGETLDVKEQHPEVVKQLMEIAEKYRRELGDDITHRTGTEIRPAAKVTLP